MSDNGPTFPIGDLPNKGTPAESESSDGRERPAGNAAAGGVQGAASPRVNGAPLREKCLAIPKGGGPPCQNPFGQCPLHCGAALRGERAGRYCPMPPCRGSTRCRMHGGKSPAGIGHPGFKGGRYSKHVPKGIRTSYERALSDTELLSLRDDLALLEARQVELLKRLAASPMPPWDAALAAFSRFVLAKDADRAGALDALGTLLRTGAAAARTQAGTWAELRELIQEKTKAAAAEARRLADLQQNLTQQQALTLVQYLIEAVQAHVHDRRTLLAIQQSLTPLLNGRRLDSLVEDENVESGAT